ncbi:MAG: SdiA-regulated domain-containing protein [Bacteroidota bacterium]
MNKIIYLAFLYTLFSTQVQAQYTLPYELGLPDHTITLPPDLKEISGISLCHQQRFIWAVQDERGIIYKIDIQAKAVVDSILFWKAGDYEGVEVVDTSIYVLKSTGTIYEVKMNQSEVVVEKFNDYLSKEDDAEGLGYSKAQHKLLVACKNGDNRKRTIYAFDLATKALDTVFYMNISKKQMIQYLKLNPQIRKQSKLVERFGEKDFDFAPSAVAIHPINEQVYVLSSRGKILLILDQEGIVLHIEKLDKKIHTQPEGLCFDQQGNLYISNEGKTDQGKIYRFNKMID